MSSRTPPTLFVIAAAIFATIQGAGVTQAQSYQDWVEVPMQFGTPIDDRQSVSANHDATSVQGCSQIVARFNALTRERISKARAFNARYGSMTLSSRQLTGFCSAYERNLSAIYDQVGEMNYLADVATAHCPARVPQAIRRQADETWADYSSATGRLGSECHYGATE